MRRRIRRLDGLGADPWQQSEYGGTPTPAPTTPQPLQPAIYMPTPQQPRSPQIVAPPPQYIAQPQPSVTITQTGRSPADAQYAANIARLVAQGLRISTVDPYAALTAPSDTYAAGAAERQATYDAAMRRAEASKQAATAAIARRAADVAAMRRQGVNPQVKASAKAESSWWDKVKAGASAAKAAVAESTSALEELYNVNIGDKLKMVGAKLEELKASKLTYEDANASVRPSGGDATYDAFGRLMSKWMSKVKTLSLQNGEKNPFPINNPFIIAGGLVSMNPGQFPNVAEMLNTSTGPKDPSTLVAAAGELNAFVDRNAGLAPPLPSTPTLSPQAEQRIRAQLQREGYDDRYIDPYIASLGGGQPAPAKQPKQQKVKNLDRRADPVESLNKIILAAQRAR